MNIDGLGEKVVEQFVQLGYIKNIADIYEVSQFENQIKALDGWGEKSYDKLINGLEQSKKQPFQKILFALGIRFIGEGGSKILAKNFNNIDELINSKYEDLIKIHEIGEKMAESIVAFFADENEIKIINKLKTAGLTLAKAPEEIDNSVQFLAGQTFVFTGELTTITRNDAAKIVEKYGGRESKSVSKKTSYVVVGDSPGSKYTKALELGVRILNEQEFNKMIEEQVVV